MSSVVLGVSGGIAAYKAAELLRLLTESGHSVRVIPTESSLSFVGAATWEALSGHAATNSVFENVDSVQHVRVGREADLIVVAPATADILARAAAGIADDLLTSTLLTADCPVLMAPAMHTEMWQHPATAANVATLRARGITVIEPASGRLTGADSGPGRLPEPDALDQEARALLRAQDLAGKRVVVSAGGTREYIDPVRYVGNSSSGRQGLAVAEAARQRGADVTVVAANVSLAAPTGVTRIDVQTGSQLRDEMHSRAADADAVVMAAAVADYAPASTQEYKLKKNSDAGELSLQLRPTADILAELVTARSGTHPVIAGFAAETGDETASVLEHGRAKLARKRCDYLVVNDVRAGQVFGSADNDAMILDAGGVTRMDAQGRKIDVAHVLWDVVTQDSL